MTMNCLKAAVGIAGVVALSACSTSPDKAGSGSVAAGSSTGSASGETSGVSNSGTSGGTGSVVTTGSAGTTGATTGTATTGTATTGTATTGTATTGTASGSGSGTPSDGGASGTSPGNSVLERGLRPSRNGNYLEPTLTTTAAATVMPVAAFNTNAVFTGGMYASPLYLANGPGGKGIYIAATTNNDIKTFDDTGMPGWTRSLVLPAAGPTFSPKGIMSTPVIDPTAGPDGFATIYACAPAAATPGGKFDHYELHAMSAKDGSERTGWPAKLDGTVMAKNDGLTRAFTPTTEGQRPALSLVNGVVYIGFGGPLGDYATYYGWVIAVDTKSPTTIGAWSTRLIGEAIWSPGGFASDGNGILTTTGNYFPGSYTAPATYGDSEAIVRLTGMPSALARSDEYYPARWKMMDTGDQDMSSSSVLLLNVPGATPANYAVTVSKDGHLYFLNSAMLGMAGGGGEVVDLTLSETNHSARISPVSYTTSSGIHIAITIDRGVMGCPGGSADGGTAGSVGMATLMGLKVVAGSPVTVTPSWCATVGGPTMADMATIKNRSASPLVTTTDGMSQPIVWVAGSASQAMANTTASLMYAVDGETGKILYSGGNCTGIRQWTTPIAVNGRIIAGGDGHLCAWSPGGQ
jgi:hypothetical protein